MLSWEISSSSCNQETNLPLSPQLVEDNGLLPCEKNMDEVEEKSKDIIKCSAEKLSVDEVSQLVISPVCGAVSLFVGTTRNNFEGKKVVSLEYEALVPVSEASIIISVSSAHRVAPLAAVSYAIDTLKAKVAI
ncbi:molybdopterin synthase catalytic subunit-like [Heterocephalus glaber]|uniref:Molybdopterin synthase catalytic subunit-like n=1 Tax=Heterocephalus glaber TaxID=10181 RepID=A0AAX6S4W3_HETGA|nr:molybdopterin synthase catalytic subunit-like [Heterocephalus glaber]